MALAGLDVTVRRATPDVFSGFAVLRPDLGVLTLRRIEGVEESWESSCGIECAIIGDFGPRNSLLLNSTLNTATRTCNR